MVAGKSYGLALFLGGGMTSIRGAVRRTDRQTGRPTDQLDWDVPTPSAW